MCHHGKQRGDISDTETVEIVVDQEKNEQKDHSWNVHQGANDVNDSKENDAK